VPFPVTGLYGTQHLEAIEPGKTLLTWTAEAESVDEEVKGTVGQQTQGLVKTSLAGLMTLLGKRQEGVNNKEVY
jgi:hypothetical protein